MKALIIGAAGFVGGHLYRHLKQELGWDVAVTKLPQERIGFAEKDVHDLDILADGAIEALLLRLRSDVIFHLAAQSSVALSWQNPDLTVDINIKGALHLLEALRKADKPVRTLLIGSGEEYGYVKENEVPVSEDNPLRPGNLYAMTKIAQAMTGQIYCRAYNLDIVMVRAFNHIGPGQAPLFVVSDFCKQVAEMELQKREPVMRVGNLMAQRDFTDVRDVVRAYGKLAQSGKSGEVYNVGSGKAHSIEQVLQTILNKSRVAVTVEQDPLKMRPSDVPILQADVAKLQADTDWKPVLSLEQSIEDTLAYWRRALEQE